MKPPRFFISPRLLMLLVPVAIFGIAATGSNAENIGSCEGFRCLRISRPIIAEDITTIHQAGIRLLEPLPPDAYIVWSDGQKPHSPGSPLENIGLLETMPDHLKFNADLKSRSSLERLIPVAVWIDDIDHRSVEFWSFLHGLNYRFLGRFHPGLDADYLILQADISPVELDLLLEHPRVRCIYPCSSKPGFDDELTAVLLVQDPVREAYFPGYKSFLQGLSLDRPDTWIGCIDSGFDTNSNLDCHVDLRGRIRGYLTYAGSINYDYNGHGTHVGGILAGNGSSEFTDTAGYLAGCGMAPYSGLVVSDALIAVPFPPAGGYPKMISDLASTGVRIISNSWHDREGTGIGYTANSAIWDAAVRDAFFDEYNPSSPVSIVFSAGNFGPGAGTIASPKEAKNIITVGACGSLRSGSSSDLWSGSSRGPCLDGRKAPTVCAPGIEILSTWPGQTHATSTGTSSAAPHIAGLISLMMQSLKDRYQFRPSPALVKGWLASIAVHPGDVLWDDDWGWGIPVSAVASLGNLPVRCSDQQHLITQAGQTVPFEIYPIDTGRPVDIVLTWTDPPAAPYAVPALVNDLDLVVLSNLSEYRGNVFNGKSSFPGGNFDRLNVIERVCLPGLLNTAVVEVRAHRIAGDGVPGNLIPFDQDFSLIVSNAVLLQQNPSIHFSRNNAGCDDAVLMTLSDIRSKGLGVVTVGIERQPDGAVFSVDMDEKWTGSGYFETMIRLCDSEDPSCIAVEDGQTICAEYSVSRDDLEIDCIQPEFENTDFEIISSRHIIFSLTSNRPVTALFKYKKIRDRSYSEIKSQDFGHSHRMIVPELEPCTWYQGYAVIEDMNGRINDTRFEIFSDYEWITDDETAVWHESMDDPPEWPVLDGAWAWGVPSGNGYPPDPTSGYTGPNVLGYNLDGNYDPQMPARNAVSPEIDCSASGEYFLRYQRWLGTESDILDKASISIRSSIKSWATVWHNPRIGLNDTHWVLMNHDITCLVEGRSDAVIRFTQGPTDPVGNRCGWNLDDISVIRSAPSIPPTPTPVTTQGSCQLEFEINKTIFHPSDDLTLTAVMSIQPDRENVAFVAVIEFGDKYLFYPEWNDQPNIENLFFESKGQHRLLLISQHWPEDLRSSFAFSFLAVLMDPETQDLLTGIRKIDCRFVSNPR